MSAPKRSKVPPALRWPIIIAFVAAFLALPELFPGNSRLYDAIATGDVAEGRRLLDAGADPNSMARGLSGLGRGMDAPEAPESPLFYAIYRNEAEIALALVEAGADPHARNREGDTALIAAADQGMAAVVRALLARGADPRAENSYNGSTALHSGRLVAGPGGRPAAKPFADPELEALLRAATTAAGE